MNTKNSRTKKNKFTFIIPTLSNIGGLSTLIIFLDRYFPSVPAVIINNDKYDLENKLDQEIPKSISIINETRNEGFAKACNDGATYAYEKYKPDYFVFLNDDVIFDYDWVTVCLDQMKRKDWVAATPTLLKIGNEVENYGYKVLPFGKVKLIKDKNYEGEVDGITAAAMIIESKVFLQLEGFDQKFFAYLEDVDLCLRMKSMGYKFGVVKNAQVIHIGQATSANFKTKRAYYNFRNWLYLIYKNWGWKKTLTNLPGILVERGRNLSGLIKSLSN